MASFPGSSRRGLGNELRVGSWEEYYELDQKYQDLLQEFDDGLRGDGLCIPKRRETFGGWDASITAEDRANRRMSMRTSGLTTFPGDSTPIASKGLRHSGPPVRKAACREKDSRVQDLESRLLDSDLRIEGFDVGNEVFEWDSTRRRKSVLGGIERPFGETRSGLLGSDLNFGGSKLGSEGLRREEARRQRYSGPVASTNARAVMLLDSERGIEGLDKRSEFGMENNRRWSLFGGLSSAFGRQRDATPDVHASGGGSDAGEAKGFGSPVTPPSEQRRRTSIASGGFGSPLAVDSDGIPVKQSSLALPTRPSLDGLYTDNFRISSNRTELGNLGSKYKIISTVGGDVGGGDGTSGDFQNGDIDIEVLVERDDRCRSERCVSNVSGQDGEETGTQGNGDHCMHVTEIEEVNVVLEKSGTVHNLSDIIESGSVRNDANDHSHAEGDCEVDGTAVLSDDMGGKCGSEPIVVEVDSTRDCDDQSDARHDGGVNVGSGMQDGSCEKDGSERILQEDVEVENALEQNDLNLVDGDCHLDVQHSGVHDGTNEKSGSDCNGDYAVEENNVKGNAIESEMVDCEFDVGTSGGVSIVTEQCGSQQNVFNAVEEQNVDPDSGVKHFNGDIQCAEESSGVSSVRLENCGTECNMADINVASGNANHSPMGGCVGIEEPEGLHGTGEHCKRKQNASKVTGVGGVQNDNEQSHADSGGLLEKGIARLPSKVDQGNNSDYLSNTIEVEEVRAGDKQVNACGNSHLDLGDSGLRDVTMEPGGCDVTASGTVESEAPVQQSVGRKSQSPGSARRVRAKKYVIDPSSLRRSPRIAALKEKQQKLEEQRKLEALQRLEAERDSPKEVKQTKKRTGRKRVRGGGRQTVRKPRAVKTPVRARTQSRRARNNPQKRRVTEPGKLGAVQEIDEMSDSSSSCNSWDEPFVRKTRQKTRGKQTRGKMYVRVRRRLDLD